MKNANVTQCASKNANVTQCDKKYSISFLTMYCNRITHKPPFCDCSILGGDSIYYCFFFFLESPKNAEK